jgi:uncharacterized caspase-like protein
VTNMRRALLVGIDDYPTSPLAGCVNDAKAMAQLLRCNHDRAPNFAPRLITSDQALISRTSLLDDIDTLFRDEADVALLFYAGHGYIDHLDGYLVTPDMKAYSEGIELSKILTLANQSKAAEVVIILDSCFSGAFGQIPASNDKNANIREGVTVLTASRPTQTASEANGGGVFTGLVCSALDGGAADVLGKVTAAGIYSYVDEALGPWEQRPLFKSHVSKLIPLRWAQPSISLETLRLLPQWFSDASSHFPLDPSYEPTEQPSHPDHELVFAQLQKCRAAKLVEPVAEEHMYYAALRSTACELTPLGRRYWQQATAGHI